MESMPSSGYRTVNRFVQYDIELTGDPVTWAAPRDGSRSVLVESVHLCFGHGEGGFFMEAHVRGPYLFRNGTPLRARADDYTGPPDSWPAWLKALAEEHRPEEYAAHRGPLSTDS